PPQAKPGVISSVSGLGLAKAPLQIQVVGKGLPLVSSLPGQGQQLYDGKLPLKKAPTLQPSKEACFLEQLHKHQGAVLHPDYKTPFGSFEDALHRLLPYHVYQGMLPSAHDYRKVDEEFEVVSTQLLKRTQAMLNKYRLLLLEESRRVSPSAEMVMIDRMFIQEEKTMLALDKQLAKEKPGGNDRKGFGWVDVGWLGWVEVGWLGWVELGWVEVGWVEVGLSWVELGWLDGVGLVGLSWLDDIGLVGLGWLDGVGLGPEVPAAAVNGTVEHVASAAAEKKPVVTYCRLPLRKTYRENVDAIVADKAPEAWAKRGGPKGLDGLKQDASRGVITSHKSQENPPAEKTRPEENPKLVFLNRGAAAPAPPKGDDSSGGLLKELVEVEDEFYRGMIKAEPPDQSSELAWEVPLPPAKRRKSESLEVDNASFSSDSPQDDSLNEHLQSAIDSILNLQQPPTGAAQNLRTPSSSYNSSSSPFSSPVHRPDAFLAPNHNGGLGARTLNR
ncbi:BICRA protein, partial [Eurystomus gularis]|nr:BICRA protein [Eurystomus gularis]